MLNESKYYIESAEKKELDYLLSNPLIRSSAVSHHSPQNQLALLMNSGASISGGHFNTSNLLSTSSPSPSPRGGGGALSKGAASEVTNESLYVIANAPTLDASQLAFPVTEKEDDHGEKETTGKGERSDGTDEAKKGTDGDDSQKSHPNKKADQDQPPATGAAAKKAMVPARQVWRVITSAQLTIDGQMFKGIHEI